MSCAIVDIGGFTLGAAKRGENDSAKLDRPSNIENLLDVDLLGLDGVINEEADHGLIGGTHTRTPAIADIDQLERGQPAEAFAGDGPRHAGARREFRLTRQRRARR